MEEKITLEVDPETGEIEIKTNGIKGPKCIDEINKLIDELALAMEYVKTDEYFQEPSVLNKTENKQTLRADKS